MNAIEKLKLVKSQADKSQIDRDNYKAYVADRKENGGWTDADVAEYRTEVERIMKSGTDDEKAAASEFWSLKAKELQSTGINARIRQSNFLDEAFKELFEERAAILHFEGCWSKEKAEALAKAEVETIRRALLEGKE